MARPAPPSPTPLAPAYLDGFGLALVVAAGVALAGALIAAIWLPARATDVDAEQVTDAAGADRTAVDPIAA